MIPLGLVLVQTAHVPSSSTAYRAGLNAGDRINAVDGQPFGPAVLGAELKKRGRSA